MGKREKKITDVNGKNEIKRAPAQGRPLLFRQKQAPVLHMFNLYFLFNRNGFCEVAGFIHIAAL